MKYVFLKLLDKIFRFNTASAHCDIPCKIYDPSTAQIATLSVIRFIDLINEISAKNSISVEDQAQIARLVREKEIHAAKVKAEINTIWGDYFKQAQFDQFPNTHSLVHSIMLTGSACKQKIDREKGITLLNLVNEFTDSFWMTKGVDTYIATCPYSPALEVVYPKLS